ncbi:MAG: hypothetical protein ABI776_10270 [Nocardioidaceae bacterium]
MEPPAGVALRWTRAVLLAAVAMISGIVAHLSMGGLLPGRTALVMLFLVCLLTAASLLGRPASTLRVVALLVAGQTFIHGALTGLAGHRGDPPLTRVAAAGLTPRPTMAPGDGRRIGSLYAQMYTTPPGAARTQLSVPAPVQHLMADLTGPHAAMALAHLAAAVAIGLWLAKGERALWTLVGLMTDEVRAMVRPVLPGTSGIVTLIGTALLRLARAHPEFGDSPRALPPRPHLLDGAVVRRGPPTLLAA